MSARDALFAAILANPDDDTARLVYADALEETAAPVAVARARFLRLQIEQSARGFDPGFSPDRAFAIQTEIDALARGWARAWLADLPASVADAIWKQRTGADAFRRGFVNGVTLPVALFCETAAGLLAAAPITELHLHGGLGASQTAGLLACPHFRQLRAVRLSGGAIGARVAGRLARCPDLGAVRALDLSGCGLNDRGALDLAKLVRRGALDLLCVRHNWLTAAGIDALVSAVPAGSGTRVVVGGNPGAVRIAPRRAEYGDKLVF